MPRHGVPAAAEIIAGRSGGSVKDERDLFRRAIFPRRDRIERTRLGIVE
jgi:hypothetical protein